MVPHHINNNFEKDGPLQQQFPSGPNTPRVTPTMIPSITTKFDKFVEFLNLAFDVITVILSLPLIIVQEIISAVHNWIRVDAKKLENLQGKVVLITGANSGIGESLAKYFYLAGCKVILAARRRNELERVRDSLLKMSTSSPGSIPTFCPTVLELDLADRNSISSKATTAIATHGTIDILINNAGIYNQGYVLDTVMEVDEQVMSVNYFGTLALTKAIGKHMVEKKQGHIAFVSSVLGKMTITNSLSYSASKHALQALADSLRAETFPDGIHVTIISPSYVKTDITINALTSTGSKYGVVTNDIKSGYSPDYVSERIFKAVVNEEGDVTIAPLTHRGAIYLRNFLPTIFFACIRLYGRRYKKQD